MAKQQPELEFLLASEESDVMGDFVQHIANGGLASYKRIAQWGEKSGEPLYTHAVNGVFAAEYIRAVLPFSDEEARVLYSAYPIHDLNKALDSEGKSFNYLATPQAVQGELEKIGVPQFFPAYRDYLEDITLLVRSHSGHYHTDAEWLIPAHNPHRLPRERLETLRSLMKALDDLDMSTTLDERDHKAGFLAFLNAHADKQYEFVYHRVSEQRGLLTNLIHNHIKDYLVERFGIVPLLFYPDGVAYLSKRGQEIAISEEDMKEIGKHVIQATTRMLRREFIGKFIRSTRQGIKVDKQFRELGIPLSEIIEAFYSRIMSKVAHKGFKNVAQLENKCRRELQSALSDRSLANLHSQVQAYLSRPNLCPLTQDGMGAGQLLQSYYIFLAKHFKKQIRNPWHRLYALLQVSSDRQAMYDLLDARYRRSYVVASDLELSLDNLLNRLLEDSQSLVAGTSRVTTTGTEATTDYTALGNYVATAATFSGPIERRMDFGDALRRYVEDNHQQCSSCGSEFVATKLMKDQVPEDIKVQSFSNRLAGGAADEPKKNVCPLCRTQSLLHKVNYQAPRKLKKSGKGGGKTAEPKTLYLHLYPYSFFTEVFLNSLRAEVREILAQETAVLFPRADEAIRAYIQSEGERMPLRFYTRNPKGNPYSNGLPLPLNYSEVIGNVLTFPLNCPGDNDSEQFLFALQQALLLGRFFGCKVLLTDSAIPVLGKSDFADLFVDNIPVGFAGLVPSNDLDREGLQQLWVDYTNLFRLRGLLYDPNSEGDLWLPLIQSLASEGRLTLYHVVDRLIEAKTKQDNPWWAIALAKECLPIIHHLTKGGKSMQALRTLAEMAWRDHIVGRDITKRNSLIKPFDMLLDGLDAKSEAFGLDTLRAQLTEDIFRHLEAIASEEYKPGRTKREKVKAYVDAFFDGVLSGAYRGNVQKLLNDLKPLRAAYLFYVREQIPSK